MNKETTQILQQLADKLGTTTEYLWAVLLKQAPISATTTLIQCISIALLGLILARLHKKFSVKVEEPGNSPYRSSRSIYDNSDALVWIMGISGLAWLILAIIAFFALSDIVNGYFNPEYWALQKVLLNL